MKNTFKLIGIIAFVAVIGFSFAACKNGSTELSVKLPGAPKASEVLAITTAGFNGDTVTKEDAEDFFCSFMYDLDTYILSALRSVDSQVFDDEFTAKYTQDLSTLYNSKALQKSFSYNLGFNNTTKFKTVTGSAGTIKGSNSGSVKLNNQTLGDYWLKVNGDSATQSEKSEREFNITELYTSPNNWQLAGIIKTKYSWDWKDTMKNKDAFPDATVDFSDSGSSTIVIMVSYYDQYNDLKGKIRFSVAGKNKGNLKNRKATTGGSDIADISDIEVYGDDDTTPVATIKWPVWELYDRGYEVLSIGETFVYSF